MANGRHVSAINAESMMVTMETIDLRADQVDKARRTAASWFAEQDGLDARDLSETLLMLGLHPDQAGDNIPTLAPETIGR